MDDRITVILAVGLFGAIILSGSFYYWLNSWNTRHNLDDTRYDFFRKIKRSISFGFIGLLLLIVSIVAFQYLNVQNIQKEPPEISPEVVEYLKELQASLAEESVEINPEISNKWIYALTLLILFGGICLIAAGFTEKPPKIFLISAGALIFAGSGGFFAINIDKVFNFSLQPKSLLSIVNNTMPQTDLTFELIGRVGPYMDGDTVGHEKNYDETLGKVINYLNKETNERELKFISVIGGADERNLIGNARKKFVSNMILARARAEKVGDALKKKMKENIEIIPLIGGRDLYVDVYALWSVTKNVSTDTSRVTNAQFEQD